MMTVGVGQVWGQDDYSGTYFIQSVSANKYTSGDYFLCPTEGWIYYEATNTFTETNNYQPFLTTYQCKSEAGYDVRKAIWKIEKSGDYYTIKHAIDGKYMVYNGKISDANVGRIRVHLEYIVTPTQDGKELFVIGTNTAGKIVISPKKEATNYFNVCQGNINDLAGSTYYNKKSKNDGPTGHANDIHGTIGLWNNKDDENAPFLLEDASSYVCETPTITFNNATNEVTISSTTSGSTIYYTMGEDPDDPTSTSNDGSGESGSSTVTIINVTNPTTIKAIATKSDKINSDVATKTITKVAMPTIDLDYNNESFTATLAPATIGSTIYYRIGTTGDFTQYENPFTVENGQTIYAYATKAGSINSETYSIIARETCVTPVITVTYNIDGTANISITSATTDATIRYTTTGTDPDENTTDIYPGIFANPVTSGMTIKAIATKEGCNNSNIATTTVAQVATPEITKENNTIKITCATEGATIYYKVDNGEPIEYSDVLGLSDNVSGRSITAYATMSNMVNSTNAEVAASETKLKLPTPIISIPDTPNDNGNVQFSINETISDEVTYYYTIDGTTSPTSSTPTSCTGFFALTAPAIIKVIATSGYYESSDVATSTSYVMPANIPILIQSKESVFYYLIPNLKTGNTDYPKNLTTLNVPCSTMKWIFEAADNDLQYYYIHNSQGGYLYYTATNNSNKYVYLNESKENSDGYKFSITAHASGGYNIIPKGQTLPINKPSIASNSSDANRLSPVKLAGAVGDAMSRWDFIPYTSTASLPQWTAEPFKVWDNDNKKFYQIKSVSQPTKPLILDNDGSIKSETIPTTNYDIRKSIWVAKKVGSDADGLLDYYTFQNAYTGELLYYNGKGRGIKDNPPTLQMGMPDGEGANDTWSHFVVVQTMSGYNIIPRAIVDNTKAISRVGTSDYDGNGFNCINRAGGNDSPGTWYDNDGGSRWTFAEYTEDVQCMKPVITYQSESEKIRISTIYDDATIYYTIDGTTPTNSSSSFVTSPMALFTEIDLADVTGVVNAYVSKTGYIDSEIVIFGLELTAPVISYDAINDKIIITQSPGSTVYYTTGETSAVDPTNQNSQYNSGSTGFDLEENINIIKARAFKGAAVSDIVTLTIPVHAHTATKDRPYLIQSVQSTAFYMIPGDVDKSVKYINTSSLGRPSMEWYFIGAGHENEVTYFYIKNKETNEYVCYTSSSVRLHTSETFNNAADNSIYKFTISYANTSTNPGYYIHPVNNTTAENGLSKKDGNNAANVLEVAPATSGNNPEYAHWNFILSTNKPAMAPQFKVWGNDGRKYYKIKNGSNYLVPRTETVTYAIASTVTGSDNSILWYFDQVYSDEWVTYYYVVNAATGEYLYFNGNVNSANNNAFIGKEEFETDKSDRYLFAFAKTTSANQYYILPKMLQELVKNNYSLVYWDKSSALSTAANRADGGGKWTLEESDVTQLCSPKITLEANGVVNLTPRTRGATVTYMVDGGAETVFESTPITSLSSGNQVVITTKTSLGETTTTKPVTVVYMPTVALAEQSVVYNGQTHAPELSSVTMGSTELKDHCVVSSDDIDAGNATAVITQKDGDPDYVIYGTAPFTIAKSPLTIYADSKMIEYGEDRPELTFSTFGLASIDVVEVNLSCASGTEIGSYPIVFNNLTSGGKYTIKRHEDGADASSNYNEDVILVTSSLIITGKSLGDGENIAEGITAEVDGEDVSVKRGTTALEEGTDYTVEKSIEGYYDDWIWTITGKGEYSGSAIVASILSNYSQKEGEWRAGYVASHDWEIPEGSGIEAWIATSVNTSANYVLVKKVDYLPAGVPVILTATANKSDRIAVSPQKVPTLTDAQKASNLLKVVTEEDGMHVNNTEVYVFYQAELVLSLAGTLAKGRIYMDNPNKTGTSAGARMLRIVKDEETTDIMVIEQTPFDIDNHWYSLDGRTLSGKPTKKGIYINDGRKVVIK